MDFFITDPAAADLAKLWDGYLERGGTEDNVTQLFDNLFRLFQRLADFPGLGLPRSYLPADTLALPYKRYMIIYRKRAGGVDIFNVLYGGMDLESYFSSE